MFYILVLALLILLELAYFKIAAKYKIHDKPNSRSSHNKITILGGGIIFYVAVLLFFLFNGFQYPFFFIGLSFIAFVSFYDDLRPQSFRVRLLAQLIAVLLMLSELDLLTTNNLLLAGAVAVLSMAVLNAYNFMDGINGMLALFSLVVTGSLFYVNRFISPFIDENLIIYLFFSLLIFGFFNVRKHAVCFSGDVGSIAMGLINLFLVGMLIKESGNYVWIGLLTIFGIDSALTLFYRILLKENITIPHRKHLFQILANEKKIPQPVISLIYALTQLIISVALIVLKNYPLYAWIFLIASIAVIIVTYYLYRKRVEHLHQPDKLTMKYPDAIEAD